MCVLWQVFCHRMIYSFILKWKEINDLKKKK